MCSYNRINGSYGCQNSKLLNGILKTELGFVSRGHCGSVHTDSNNIHSKDLLRPTGMRSMLALQAQMLEWIS